MALHTAGFSPSEIGAVCLFDQLPQKQLPGSFFITKSVDDCIFSSTLSSAQMEPLYTHLLTAYTWCVTTRQKKQ